MGHLFVCFFKLDSTDKNQLFWFSFFKQLRLHHYFCRNWIYLKLRFIAAHSVRSVYTLLS